MRLHTKILLGLVAGSVLGSLSNALSLTWLQTTFALIAPLGTIFIRLLTMILIPLIVASLMVGVSSLGDLRTLGRIGGKTLVYFVVTTVMAASLGLVLARAVQPGATLDAETRATLAAEYANATANVGQAAAEAPGTLQMLVQIIPRNPFQAAADMDLLGVIAFTLIFGAALGLARQKGLVQGHVVQFFEEINTGSMLVIGWVMKLAPYAVFALIAADTSRFGLQLLQTLLVYCLVVVAGLLIFVCTVFFFVIHFMAKMSIPQFFRGIAEPMLLAFSTSSSNACLPLSISAAENKLGISKGVAGFVVPLGATLNKNGAALYKAVTALFIAQVYGVDLSMGQQLTVILASTLAAIGGGGVPGSSLVTTLVVLNAAGLGSHAEVGIALVAGVDRILDMCRTTVNVVDDLVCAAFIAKSEGETLASAS
jgi:Na+/H+-dicarboxylate symporter